MIRILEASQAQVTIESEVCSFSVLGGVRHRIKVDNLFVNRVGKDCGFNQVQRAMWHV